MNQEEIGILQKYAGKKIATLGQEILEGNIAINPKIFKKKDSCTFCQFQGICDFDSRLHGFEKKELEDMGIKELLEIYKEVNDAYKANKG